MVGQHSCGGHEHEEEPIFEDDSIYGGLDASQTLVIHGLESDWIEEEMAVDDEFT